jgi:hypothetical protein
MLVHRDDLARRDDLDIRRQLATGMLPDRGRVADEEDLIFGVRPGMVERPWNDL